MHPVRALFDHEGWATPGTLGTIPRTMTNVVGTGQLILGANGLRLPDADAWASGTTPGALLAS
jgi:hypothetical protein